MANEEAKPFAVSPQHPMKVLIDSVCNTDSPITDGELKRIQQLVIGEKDCTLEEVHSIKEPLFFFNYLLTKRLLTRFNLTYFQFLLFQVGRKDLVKIVEDYGRASQHDAIFFQTPETTSGENSKLCRLHIKNNKCTNFGEMDQLRDNVAKYLGIPPGELKVVGLQSTDSLLLTVLIPAKYCTELMDRTDLLQKLGQLDIDEIEIDGKKIEIKINSKLSPNDT